ncbi:phytanoyl-CoA dioxygenase family protein [Actinocrispum sp. NPDC049592]|uniref:phytanoyl-CoA dioxygenase family protein n=1 Tax=Actinocrispum sp. NPDC049592 TaxID=3154835 RepID=UPI003448787C
MTHSMTRWTPMTSAEREQFEQDGYLIIRNALNATEVDYYKAVVDRVYAASPEAASGASLHLLSAVTSCPPLAGLIDHPSVFGRVWSALGWNVHTYHSHIDVHPRIEGREPFWWQWHQDGGRQNREIETDPRPRMSVKTAFWLSDVSVPGRGNLTIVPGSHRTNWLPGPPQRGMVWPQPQGAIEVTVNPGDVLFFDRRLWHARADNYSQVTRKVVFFGYTYRWIAIRDETGDLLEQPWFQDLNPVQRQLLGFAGDGSGDHQWGHYPASTPLYTELSAQGLLDPSHPPLIP